jgi:eukaryotic-like serine/threonine-protein kinase
MTPERWQRAQELFAEALERPAAERSAFLERECAGDEALRAELQSLLADGREAWGAGLPVLVRAELASLLAQEHAPGDSSSSQAIFSAGSATASGDPITRMGEPGSVSQAPARTLPTAIGHYRIVGFVGKGGMAVVYKAEQQEPRRIVALKVIKPGLVGPEYERRFEREKDALARLQHEGIARIYEAGTADSGSGPQPYFAMELIEQGQPLTEYAESKRLTARQRLELMAQVCDAVHHAHQHFVIHRDLKQSNILVD